MQISWKILESSKIITHMQFKCILDRWSEAWSIWQKLSIADHGRCRLLWKRRFSMAVSDTLNFPAEHNQSLHVSDDSFWSWMERLIKYLEHMFWPQSRHRGFPVHNIKAQLGGNETHWCGLARSWWPYTACRKIKKIAEKNSTIVISKSWISGSPTISTTNCWENSMPQTITGCWTFSFSCSS